MSARFGPRNICVIEKRDLCSIRKKCHRVQDKYTAVYRRQITQFVFINQLSDHEQQATATRENDFRFTGWHCQSVISVNIDRTKLCTDTQLFGDIFIIYLLRNNNRQTSRAQARKTYHCSKKLRHH